jgi:aminoglycoside phosphotransferase (APT) family kinase protein
MSRTQGITMESKTKNKKSRAQIERMAERAFGGLGLAPQDDAVNELKLGWFNAAYEVRLADGRAVILKIAPPPAAEVMQYEKNIMATEVAAMRRVRQNPAIPVPEIFYYDNHHDLCDSDYFFMEKVEGDTLEHVIAALAPDVRAGIERQIGAIIREINGFGGVYFGYDGNPALRGTTWRATFGVLMEALLADAARKGASFDFGYDELRAAVNKHAAALDEVTTPCLVHWDAWNPNFFVRDGKVTGIIDFERALWAEPLMEAQFRQFRQFGVDGVSESMRGYGKTEFTFAEEQRSRLYALHLTLTMNVECYYRNYDTDDIFNLSRALIAETMAWLQAN